MSVQTGLPAARHRVAAWAFPPVALLLGALGLAPGSATGQEAPRLAYRAEMVQDERAFGRPWLLVVGPDTRLYATYPFERTIRVYPGAIQANEADVMSVAGVAESDSFPRLAGWVGDTLWLADFRTSEAVLFGPDMRPLRSLRLTPPPQSGQVLQGRVLGLLPGSRVLIETYGTALALALANPGSTGAPSGLPGEAVTALPVWVAEADGRVLDTLALVPAGRQVAGPIWTTSPETGRSRMLLRPEPFADNPLVAVDPLTSILVTVDRTVGGTGAAAYTLRRISVGTGDTLSVRQYLYHPVPLTSSWREEALARAAGASADDPETLSRIREGLFWPESLPPVSEIRVGPDGVVWLRREEVPGAQTVRWEILDETGQRLGFIELPSTLRVRAVHHLTGWATRPGGDDNVQLWQISVLRE